MLYCLYAIVGLNIKTFSLNLFKGFKRLYYCLASLNTRVSYLSVEPLTEIENFHAAGPERPSKDVFFYSKVYS